MWPRDENLRLIGAEEEARHIGARLRSAQRATVGCWLAAAGCFGACYVVASGSLPWNLSAAARETALVWAALACSLCCFFGVFYGVRSIRYGRYRRQHRAFLRKYNRL